MRVIVFQTYRLMLSYHYNDGILFIMLPFWTKNKEQHYINKTIHRVQNYKPMTMKDFIGRFLNVIWSIKETVR